jgi:predicted RNase H-like HicB family nuclease
MWRNKMKKLEYTYWKDGEFFLGYLNDYPDHMTQGKTLKELEEMLKSLYEDFSAHGNGVKQRGILVVA